MSALLWVEHALYTKSSTCIIVLSIVPDERFSFDVDLPTECDDEYWVADDLGNAFKQPPGLPSQMSYFVWMIKLSNIRAKANRRIVRCIYFPEDASF